MSPHQKSRPDSSNSEWNAFERQIRRGPSIRPAAGGRSRAATSVSAFDPLHDDVLRRLAERSQLERKRGGPRGNVVFLHGICGADLGVAKKKGGNPAHVWARIPSILLGHLKQLMLSEDAKREADSSLRVLPIGINKRFYGRAVVALRAHWDVEPFAYDWRKDIEEASRSLATFIQNRFGNEPVHLVAHSLGGLVARNMIRQYPKLWKSMQGSDPSRGGRLVMLGTPNYGSYAIAQVLTGVDPLVERLARFDLKHNLPELLEITNSFLGSFMLLPAYEKLPPSLQRLYERGTWGATPRISQAHLDRAITFYKALDTPETLDAERLSYIAGANQPTITSMSISAPEEFEYTFTKAGDGRVPHTLGLLPGVPAYYIDEVHGDLARNEKVLRALDDILEKGKTAELTSTAPAARMAPEVGGGSLARQYRGGAERAALDILDGLATRVRAAGDVNVLTPEEQQVAADAILHGALGSRAPVIVPKGDESTLQEPRKRMRASGDGLPLNVRVRFENIVNIKAPMVVVGHYRGVTPVKAIGALDERFKGWISRAVKRGMISGHVGETFLIPTDGTTIGARMALIAGMGDYGAFSEGALRQLMSNVAQAAAALQLKTAATVLVGTGEGNLPLDRALRCLLDGIGAGLLELREEMEGRTLSLTTLWIVENNPQRFEEIDAILANLAKHELIDSVKLNYRAALGDDRARAARKLRASVRTQAKAHAKVSATEFNEVRLTVECERAKDVFRFSVLTNKAVVSAREIPVSVAKVELAAEALARAEGRAAQLRYGRLLFNYLFPEEFQPLFEKGVPVRLIVDPTSAALPWEMAAFSDGTSAERFQRLGIERSLTRQFRTLLSRSPGVVPPRDWRLRALVIADPAPEPEWQLPGARTEGRVVARLLREMNGKPLDDGLPTMEIVVEDRIGPAEADPVDIRALMCSGDFDILHFAGHGDYKPGDPANSGWVLGAGDYLTANEMFRARKVPWLIVANACYSGVLRTSDPYPSPEVARGVASIAEAFLERGVPNYLGTGWTVDDRQAVRFAEVFYRALLGNELLGKAVEQARRTVFSEPLGSTWGAYQFYGDPADQLMRHEDRRRGS